MANCNRRQWTELRSEEWINVVKRDGRSGGKGEEQRECECERGMRRGEDTIAR